jgi:putative photosynthetic complex assembly protein
MSNTAHHHHDDPTVPRGALIGIAALLIATMAFTGAVSFGLLPQSANPEASRAAIGSEVAAERMLRFADRADGAVVVSDAATGASVAIIDYGKGGFVRATLRRLAKARAAKGIDAAQPFRLVRWDNGALSLSDPQTGKSAEIYGFGADHVKAFADMLEDSRA